MDINSSFKYPISISDAIANIEKRKYLLPAIQRKFVWSSEKIEILFDSIMRDYPINSFMMWNVTSDHTKNSYKFYEFLKEYREFFKDENPYFNTKGYQDFLAVIDGQQRLTSLYLGLKGSYAYKMPRKWWKDNEDCLPTRRLYINLSSELKDDESSKIYDFKFLSESDFTRLSITEDLFLVNDIYLYKDSDSLEDFMADKDWLNAKFAKKTLRKLRKVIFDDKLINYYQEENQNIDTVLDIFIRTNSGGEPLSFSNLLMSITTANWKKDARKEFKALIDSVYANNFIISADLILKCCLVLFKDNNIKFQVVNFDTNTFNAIELNWNKIRKCIEVTFELLKKWGFNDSSLRAKNAIIPIVYYIYHRNIENSILKDHLHKDEKSAIRKWLCISLLKGVFGGHSDSVLTSIRKVLKQEIRNNIFPFEQIKAEFASNDAKSLSLSDEVIEDILKTQKDAPNCYAVLALLYSHLHYDTVSYHKDHLHPASRFQKLKESDFTDNEKYKFFKNPENWNSILNLQLLSGSTNESKNDEDLKEWVKEKNISRKSQLIPTGVSLDFVDFENFIEERKQLLINTIKSIIGA